MENLRAKIDGQEIEVERLDGGPSNDGDRPERDADAGQPLVPLDPTATRKAFFWGAAAAAGAAGLGLLVRTLWNNLGRGEPPPPGRVKRKRKKKKRHAS